MDTEVVGLGRYWSAIRRRRWIVLGFVLVFAIVVSGYVETRAAKYEATAQVLIKPYSTGQFNEAAFTTAQVDTQVQVMQSLTIVAPVVSRLHLNEAPTKLQKSISTSSIGDTSVIEVTVSSDSATQAASIANALADRYLQFRRNGLPPNARGSFATIVSRAQPPQHKSGPSLIVGGLLGVVLGLVLGCAVALAVEHRDESLTHESAIDEVTGGQPILGRIPVTKRKARPRAVDNPGSEEAIAYQFLATHVRLLRQEQQSASASPHPMVVLVSSPAPRDGRTTVAANLALAAAEAGQHVVLCDGDLSQPALSRLLDLTSEVTVETLLRRPLQVSLDMLAQPAPRLYALGSGGVFSGQAALVGEGRFRGLVGSLPEIVDLVVVDTSPLLSAAEVLDLVPQADVVLLVVRERFTKGPDLAAGLERIRQVGGAVTGIVISGSYSSMGTQRKTRRRGTA